MKLVLIFFLILYNLPLALGQGEAKNTLANDGGILTDINGNIQVTHSFSVPQNGMHAIPVIASDCEGNLLFYFSQHILKNRYHLKIQNSDTLHSGSFSLTSQRSANLASLKKPGSDSIYFVFSATGLLPPPPTTSQVTDYKLEYAIVNMAANNDSGVVVSKYNIIRNTTSDGFTLVRHANKKWYWFINYDWFNGSFHYYLVRETGIFFSHSQTMSIPYASGRTFARFYPSPKGDKIALVSYAGSQEINLFDFDNRTGLLANHIVLNVRGFVNNGQYVNSAEFSPNSNFLYLKIHYPYIQGTLPMPGITQVDLRLWDVDSIYSNSVTFSGQNHDFIYVPGIIKGKIYLRVSNGNGVYHLGRIEYPDLEYPACMVIDTFLFHQPFFLGGSYDYPFSRHLSHLNLPDRYGISAENFCFGDTTILDLNDYDNLRSISWHFGDSLATINTSNDTTPRHVFSQPGTYTVTAFAEYCNRMDTLTKTITIVGEPARSGINDTAFCVGDALNLQLNDTLGQNYRWSDNDTSRNKTITAGGWHWLETSNACFTRRDSFYVDVHEPPAHGLPSDTSFCAGDVITLSPAAGNYRWVWNDGDTLPKNISTPGSYLLIMDNSCGSFPFAVQVAEREPPIPATPADTLICEGRVLRVELPDLLNTSYQWQDGSNERIRLLSDTGWYEVTATNECGSNSRGFQLNTDDCSCNIYIPNAFSPNGDGLNDQFELQSRCRISQYELVIYNRWGQQLFKSNDITHSWDGYYQSELLPVGEYVYHLYYYREGLGPRQTKGSFRLLR